MRIFLTILSALERLRKIIRDEIFRQKIEKVTEDVKGAETDEQKDKAIDDIREAVYGTNDDAKPDSVSDGKKPV